MSIIVDITQFIDQYFKSIVTMISFCFTVYFSFQKLTTKVTAEYSISGSTFLENYISDMVLTNKRDKPICIWAIYAVFDKDKLLEMDKFNPPKVLKPYESIGISLPKFTKLYIESDNFEVNYNFENTEVYLDIGDKFVKCDSEYRKNSLSHFNKIRKVTFRFGDNVYSENVDFILQYVFQEKTYTAFIHASGFIGNQWSFAPNHLGGNATVKNIESLIENDGFKELFSNYLCYKVNKPSLELELVLTKSANP